MTDSKVSAEKFWDDLYGREVRVFTSHVNESLQHEAADLPPATALDLGCAEGADAIWLARRGWQVTGVDVSGVALKRAAEHAARAGVAERISWQQHDLAVSFPDGEFDLVSAQFLHSYLELPRERILRAAAAAVAPGGVLLIVGHGGAPSWEPDAEIHAGLPAPMQVLAGLHLPEHGWTVVRSAEYLRELTGPDGRPATRPDNVLMLRRDS